MSPQFHTVDLLLSAPSTLSVQWRGPPGERSRPVDPATISQIEQQRSAVEEAENHGTPKELAEAQQKLGDMLARLLDGPERALLRRLEAARTSGRPLNLVVRLRASEPQTLPRHPALGWHLQLLRPPPPSSEPPLALQPDVTLTVQLGPVEAAAPEVLPHGFLHLLFMAFSPRGEEPVLAYELEEELILDNLAPFIEQRRLAVRVAEEGSLAELRRRVMQRAYDVVHLSGHGILTDAGPRLLMEDEDGHRAEVSPEQLLKTLRAGRLPPLLVLSSCHSAEHRSDLPSLAAQLVQGGLPCVVGWTVPVGDGVAARASVELYHRLCSGELPAQAVARARQFLHEEDQERSLPLQTWATLQLLTTQPAGFRIDRNTPPASAENPVPELTYRWLRVRMGVLERGFVGRRRELQALGRLLRRGRWADLGEPERSVAGAVIVGLTGQGKSCLASRTLERQLEDNPQLGVVVLRGGLDAFSLQEAFRIEAVRLNDPAAEAMLDDGSQPLMRRLELLVRHHWRERHLVIVLDGFEQNLAPAQEGEPRRRLQPLAISLLEVLVPACQDALPKLLLTSTAFFALPPPFQRALAELPLGALDGASARKLRRRSELSRRIVTSAWTTLSERLGRNARLLDWARELLEGKTPSEVRDLAAQTGLPLPVWTSMAPGVVQPEALVALFRKQLACEEALATLEPDVRTFLERVRVYEEPVPAEALTALTEGLSVSLDHHLMAPANLGLLEVGTEGGTWVYRVSPLVKETFDAPDGERWHAVAANHWWKAAQRGKDWPLLELIQAWRHALQAKLQKIADDAADPLRRWLDSLGRFAESVHLAQQHVAAFPLSVAGIIWEADALQRKGQPSEAVPLLKRGIQLARSLPGEQARLQRAEELLTRVRGSF